MSTAKTHIALLCDQGRHPFEFTAGEALVFDLTVMDPATLGTLAPLPLDITSYVVVFAIRQANPDGTGTGEPLIARQCTPTTPTTGNCSVEFAPSETAPEDPTLPSWCGAYVADAWLKGTDGSQYPVMAASLVQVWEAEQRPSQTVTPLPPSTPLGVGSGTVLWTPDLNWATVSAKINAMLDAGLACDVFIDNELNSEADFVINTPFDFDRVRFIGLDDGGASLIFDTGSQVLSARLWCYNVLVFFNVTVFTFNPSSPLYLRWYFGGTAGAAFSNRTNVPAAILGGTDTHNVACEMTSLGGSGWPMFLLQQNASLSIIAYNEAFTFGDDAGLAAGATAANVYIGNDASCEHVGNFPSGITLTISPLGNAAFLPYAPTTPSNWPEGAPVQAKDAIDKLAARSAGSAGGPLKGSSLTLTADPDTVTVYYCRMSGNDSTGDGSVGNPWRHVEHALAQVFTMRVGGGRYRIDCTGLAETGYTCTLPPFFADVGEVFNASPLHPAGIFEGYITITATPTVLLTLGNDATVATDPVTGMLIVTQPSATWTPGAFVGQQLASATVFQCGIIFRNTATQIWCTANSLTAPLQVIEPGASFVGASNIPTFQLENVNALVCFNGLSITNANPATAAIQANNGGGIFVMGGSIGIVDCGLAGANKDVEFWTTFISGAGGQSTTDFVLVGQQRYSNCFWENSTPDLQTDAISFSDCALFNLRLMDSTTGPWPGIAYSGCYINGQGVLVMGMCSIASTWIEDATSANSPHQNPNGSAIVVFAGGALQLNPDGGNVEGTGNAGYGVELQEGARCAFQSGHEPTSATLTVTGGLGDLLVGRRARTWADFFTNHPIRTWADPSTGASIGPIHAAEVVPLYEPYSTAGRPAANAVAAGTVIRNTDTGRLQQSNGTTWLDGAITADIVWTPAQNWAAISAQVTDALGAGQHVTLWLDRQYANSPFTINTPFNLDNVMIRSVNENGAILILANGFTHTGANLAIEGIELQVQTQFWAWTSGAHGFTMRAVDSTIVVSAGIIAISVGSNTSILSLFDVGMDIGGGFTGAFVGLQQGADITIVATDSGIAPGHVVLNPSVTAAELDLFIDATVYLGSRAWGAGITVTYSRSGDAWCANYIPGVSGNWSPAPNNVSDALDQLAARPSGDGSRHFVYTFTGSEGTLFAIAIPGAAMANTSFGAHFQQSSAHDFGAPTEIAASRTTGLVECQTSYQLPAGATMNVHLKPFTS